MYLFESCSCPWISSSQTLSLEDSIHIFRITGKEMDSSLMVEGDSFIFKTSLRRAPDTGKPKQMERCVRLSGCVNLRLVQNQRMPLQNKGMPCNTLSAVKLSRDIKKWPGRPSGERENANNEAFSFQPNYQYLIGMTAFPHGISTHHFTAISKSHIL